MTAAPACSGGITQRGVLVDTANAIIHRFSIKHRKHKHGSDGESKTARDGWYAPILELFKRK